MDFNCVLEISDDYIKRSSNPSQPFRPVSKAKLASRAGDWGYKAREALNPNEFLIYRNKDGREELVRIASSYQERTSDGFVIIPVELVTRDGKVIVFDFMSESRKIRRPNPKAITNSLLSDEELISNIEKRIGFLTKKKTILSENEKEILLGIHHANKGKLYSLNFADKRKLYEDATQALTDRIKNPKLRKKVIKALSDEGFLGSTWDTGRNVEFNRRIPLDDRLDEITRALTHHFNTDFKVAIPWQFKDELLEMIGKNKKGVEGMTPQERGGMYRRLYKMTYKAFGISSEHGVDEAESAARFLMKYGFMDAPPKLKKPRVKIEPLETKIGVARGKNHQVYLENKDSLVLYRPTAIEDALRDKYFWPGHPFSFSDSEVEKITKIILENDKPISKMSLSEQQALREKIYEAIKSKIVGASGTVYDENDAYKAAEYLMRYGLLEKPLSIKTASDKMPANLIYVHTKNDGSEELVRVVSNKITGFNSREPSKMMNADGDVLPFNSRTKSKFRRADPKVIENSRLPDDDLIAGIEKRIGFLTKKKAKLSKKERELLLGIHHANEGKLYSLGFGDKRKLFEDATEALKRHISKPDARKKVIKALSDEGFLGSMWETGRNKNFNKNIPIDKRIDRIERALTFHLNTDFKVAIPWEFEFELLDIISKNKKGVEGLSPQARSGMERRLNRIIYKALSISSEHGVDEADAAAKYLMKYGYMDAPSAVTKPKIKVKPLERKIGAVRGKNKAVYLENRDDLILHKPRAIENALREKYFWPGHPLSFSDSEVEKLTKIILENDKPISKLSLSEQQALRKKVYNVVKNRIVGAPGMAYDENDAYKAVEYLMRYGFLEKPQSIGTAIDRMPADLLYVHTKSDGGEELVRVVSTKATDLNSREPTRMMNARGEVIPYNSKTKSSFYMADPKVIETSRLPDNELIVGMESRIGFLTKKKTKLSKREREILLGIHRSNAGKLYSLNFADKRRLFEDATDALKRHIKNPELRKKVIKALADEGFLGTASDSIFATARNRKIPLDERIDAIDRALTRHFNTDFKVKIQWDDKEELIRLISKNNNGAAKLSEKEQELLLERVSAMLYKSFGISSSHGYGEADRGAQFLLKYGYLDNPSATKPARVVSSNAKPVRKLIGKQYQRNRSLPIDQKVEAIEKSLQKFFNTDFKFKFKESDAKELVEIISENSGRISDMSLEDQEILRQRIVRVVRGPLSISTDYSEESIYKAVEQLLKYGLLEKP